MFGVAIEPATRRCEWIVCRGELHSVSSGTVHCPRRAVVSVESCLGCHWLEDADQDRSDSSDCHSQEVWLAGSSPETARDEGPTYPAASPPWLMVELL
jgi:hypothetical protein